MAQVTLQINGYGYVLGCADGEEDHLRMLADDLERRIAEITETTGSGGEARMLLMAALVISDELHDLRQQSESATQPATPPEPKIGRRLRGIAKRAETIADAAEAPPAEAPSAEAPSAEAPPATAAADSHAAETTPPDHEQVAATGDQA